MAKRNTDRRTQRTRQALMAAFVELVLARGYEDVGIGEIIRKANIGRSTFYLHYASKEALLKASLEHPSDQLAACVAGEVTPQLLAPLLDHFREQRTVNRVFFEHPIRTVWVKSLAALIEPRLAGIAHAGGARPPIPRRLTALVVAEMQVALITHWLTGKFSLKSEVVAAALIANTRRTLAGASPG